MVSIIIPVYNVEKVLRRCLDSVIVQAYTDFELILVDDGSTDASGSICDKYAKSDSRIRVFHKSNAGVSSARNVGLDEARGEWVIFIDSDDYWLDVNALARLVECGEDLNVDVVRGDYVAVDYFENEISKVNVLRDPDLYNKAIPAGVFLKEIVKHEFFSVLWLIKRNSIGDLRFNERQSFLEDMRFLIELTANPLKCAYIDFPFYAYRKYDSIGSNNPDIKRVSDSFAMCDFFWQQGALAVDDTEYLKFCRYYGVMLFCWTVQTIADDVFFHKRHRIIEQCGLKKLRQRSLLRAKSISLQAGIKESISLYLSPEKSSMFFRVYNTVHRTFRWITLS